MAASSIRRCVEMTGEKAEKRVVKKAGKERIKHAVLEKLRRNYLVEIEAATQEQLFRAVSDAVMDIIAENWLDTKKAVEEQDIRTVYYLSMEFLIGRVLGNNLINLGAWDEVYDALEELGVALNALEDQEPDPALGNGGLGRLAACFSESLATLGYSAVGCGIRYHYGLFRQAVVNGFQVEQPDIWLDGGYPFEVRHPEEARVVRFGGYVDTVQNSRTGGYAFVHKGGSTVLAVPYDIPIVGYGNKIVNTLRLWDAEAITSGESDYDTIMDQRRFAEKLSGVLYPDDSTDAGKKLRIMQEYFFTSASVQTAVADYKKGHDEITKLPEKVVFQMNDTHSAVMIPELMRILMDEEGLGWDEAWAVTAKCGNFTNHTVMCESIEAWPASIFSVVLPRIYQIIVEINGRFVREIEERYPHDPDRVRRMAIIHDDKIRMANLCFVAASCVNGVAKLHTNILKNRLFRDFHEMMPDKIVNITNGATQRRFLLHGNPLLARWITGHIGPSWITDFSQIGKMAVYADDGRAQQEFMRIRHCNKERFAEYILENKGIEVDPYSIYDVQVKRAHLYKRQLLLTLYIIYLYDRIRRNPGECGLYPRTFIFGGKAAASYYMAKLSIKLINSVADVINHDPSVNDIIKVVFIENYRVSNAELIFAAADVSEQISTAGREASGTSCAKMQMSGCPIIGTMDGANVEIVEAAGLENEFIFGLSADQIAYYEQYGGYDPLSIYQSDDEIRQVLNRLVDGTFSADTELFRDIYNDLLYGKDGRPDSFFVLADFRSYIEAQKRVDEAYRDRRRWAKMSILNMAHSGRFSSDRAVEEYVQKIWHLQKAKPEHRKQ